MYEMLSSNLRGGMSFTSQRYAESAVFEDMMGVQRSVDEDGRFNLIQYIDANALYASCQTFPLPYTGFKFLSDEEISKIDWATIDLMQDIGYFVEVSLLYPKNIWEKTKSYPLCPQNLEITHDMLSPYQKDVLLKLYNKKTYKQKKLTATFETREKIVLHALNLQQYLKFGMKLLKIFRVIEFKQKPYMTPWIDFCTKKRTESKNDFEKKFWKDYVNSLFGKTIEGVANRKKVIICTSPEKFKKNLSNPNYERHIIVNEEIAIVIKSIEKAKVRRPYYIGFSVLEISKYIMYNFFYEILQPYFGIDGCAVLYQDTDSFVLNLKTKDIISDLKTLSVNMDFSNLHENHPLFSMKNKTQLFKFKEEFALKPISRFCALKSKCYSFELACEHKEGINKEGVCFRCNNTPKNKNTSHYNRLKGVQQSTARQIHFEKYVKCISSVYCRRDHVRQITSKAQKITTNFLNKISISSFDDKRYLLNCGIHSEPYHQKNKPYCLFCKM